MPSQIFFERRYRLPFDQLSVSKRGNCRLNSENEQENGKENCCKTPGKKAHPEHFEALQHMLCLRL